MRGVFFVARQIAFTFGAGSFASADAFNSTRVYTNANKSTSVELGTHYTNANGVTQYQPYWVTYGPQYTYHAISAAHAGPDNLNHTFTAIRSCATCTTWDVGFDYRKIATASGQTNGYSQYVTSGWDVWGEYGKTTFAAQPNRLQFLTGNNNWNRFEYASTVVAQNAGDCTAGADPEYCWQFTVTRGSETVGGVKKLVYAQFTKPLVTPAGAAAALPRESGETATRRAQAAGAGQLMSSAEALAFVDRLRGASRSTPNKTAKTVESGRPGGDRAPITIAAATSGPSMAAQGLDFSPEYGAGRPLWIVASSGKMPTLTGDRVMMDGFVLAIDRTTRMVVEACLGQGCRASGGDQALSRDSGRP
jgi:hypothetical protein